MNLPVATTHQGDDLPQQISGSKYRTLEEFTRFMNKEPFAAEIFVNKAAGNSKYMPIGIVQTKLDEVFAGMWQTSNFRYSPVVNELCGTITLRFFHPVIQQWMEREGSAAVMIRQNSGAAITDLDKKLKNALVMDLPHLHASCIAAAARSLGKAFGRDLNRQADKVAEYETIYSDMADEKAVSETNLKSAANLEELSSVYSSLPEELKELPAIIKAYKFRANQLKAQTNQTK